MLTLEIHREPAGNDVPQHAIPDSIRILDDFGAALMRIRKGGELVLGELGKGPTTEVYDRRKGSPATPPKLSDQEIYDRVAANEDLSLKAECARRLGLVCSVRETMDGFTAMTDYDASKWFEYTLVTTITEKIGKDRIRTVIRQLADDRGEGQWKGSMRILQ